VSWDGEEAWSSPPGKPAGPPGSRAYVQSLGPEARNLVAALVVEMCGWKDGKAVLHTIAYDDPLRPGRFVIAPGWLVESVQRGSRQAGAFLPVGDPVLSWLYQPGVRAFRGTEYGDDLSFLKAGLPAIFVSDSSFSRFFPWYHQAGDTADKIDAASLARMGQAVLGAVDALAHTPRSGNEPTWFSAFGRVEGGDLLVAIGVASCIPGVMVAFRAGGFALGVRLLQAGVFLVLLLRNPVPILWSFLLPNVLSVPRRRFLAALSLLPLVSLVLLGALAWQRGFVSGVWLGPLELIGVGVGLALLFLPSAPRRTPLKKTTRRRG
jgi:hypothetical protein